MWQTLKSTSHVLIFKNDVIHNVHCYFVFFGIPVVILSIYRINVFFCLKNKLKIPNRPHTSNNCSELRKSYKQHGYLDKNNSRHTVNFFPFSQHTVNFLDVSRHTLNPIETLLCGVLFSWANKNFLFWRLWNDCQIARPALVSGPPPRRSHISL